MNFSFFIAKKYFFSKKKKSFINLLSITAFIGVVVGTSSLIIVLSVFNGLENLLKSLYGNFDPEIKIISNQSKYFDNSHNLMAKIEKVKGIEVISKVIEDKALASYNNSELALYIKGVDSSFYKQNRLQNNIVEGSFILSDNKQEYVIIGRGIKYKLSLNLNNNFNNLDLFSVSPNFSFTPSVINKKPFNKLRATPSGVFAIEQNFDNNYIISSLNFTEKLFDKKNKITAFELKLHSKSSAKNIKKELEDLIGDRYSVLTIEEQHAALYKILKTEKLMVFLIFSFILIISSFNIFFLLSMLAIDKKRDLTILLSLGINENYIKKIFVFEGVIISFLGVVFGTFFGVLICFLQDQFGLVSLGMNTAVVENYPVKILLGDVIMVVVLVFVITLIASLKPAQMAINKIDVLQLNNK